MTFDHNTFIDDDDPNDTKTGHAYMFANGGNTDAHIENITYSNNRLYNQQITTYINLGPDLSRRHTTRKNIKIINNTTDLSVGSPFPDQAPIRAAGIIGFEVRGNTQPIQPNQRNFGVSVYGAGDGPSSGVVVKDNTFLSALGALYTDPAIPDATVCNNRVGLDHAMDRACVDACGEERHRAAEDRGSRRRQHALGGRRSSRPARRARRGAWSTWSAGVRSSTSPTWATRCRARRAGSSSGARSGSRTARTS